MKNHWLPKFYLRRFVRDDGKLLWLYFKETKKYEHKSPRVIARQKNYYTDEIENFFMLIENMTAPVLLKVDNREKLNSTDKLKIAIFISFLRVRVQFFESITRKKFEKTKEKFIEDKVSTEEKAKLFIEIFEKKYNRKSDMNAKELLDYINSNPSELKFGRNRYFFYLMKRIGRKQIDLLMKMSWTFMFASRGSSFIICDNPFTLYDLKTKNLNALFGIAETNIIKLVPLGRNVCLFINKLTNNPVLTKYEVHSKKVTRLLNTFIMDNSNKFIGAGDKKQLEKLVKMRIKNN